MPGVTIADVTTIAEPVVFKGGTHVVVGALRYSVPMLSQHVYAVRDRDDGETVLEVLSSAFRKHRGTQPMEESRAYWREVIDGGRVKLKRHKLFREDRDSFTEKFCTVPHDHILHKQDRLEITKHQHDRAVSGAPVDILLDDGRFVVVNKPAGIPCVSGEGGNNNIVDITAQLLNLPKLHLLHRLDVNVSGVQILTRGGKAARLGLQELASRRVFKRYIASVEGNFPEEATCTSPLSFDTKLGRSVVRPVSEGGKPATTHFKRLSHDVKRNTSIVEASPVSGLRHQIRAHLATLGAPIVYDATYGAAKGPPGAELYLDDDRGTLREVLRSSRQTWCGKCDWVEKALCDRPNEMPTADTAIHLHAVHYEVCRGEEGGGGGWVFRCKRVGVVLLAKRGGGSF